MWKSVKSAPINRPIIVEILPYNGQKLMITDAEFRWGSWWQNNGGNGYTAQCHPRRWLDISW